MTAPLVRARAADAVPVPEPIRDPAVVDAYLEDASAAPRGSSPGLLRPENEREAAAFLRATSGRGVPVLPQAGRSSLTGGAVPRGEWILSVEKMTAIGPVEPRDHGRVVRVGPGVRLRDLQRVLAAGGWYYPPVPTYQDAMVGGTVSTNAGGAATFKYGVTRDWVEGLRVVLGNGDVLSIARGEAIARPGETFRIELSDGRVVEAPVPTYRLPHVKKLSAGYFASDPLDLVDLFVGSEGTLGLLTEATLRLVPLPAAVVTAVAFLPSLEIAFDLAADLRAAGERARSDPSSPDVRAVELLDGNCLDLLRRHGDARRLRVRVPDAARSALLLEAELGSAPATQDAEAAIEAAMEGRAGRGGPLASLFDLLVRRGVMDDLELALPGDDARQEALRELREAVPRRVNEILAARRREDPAIHKVGGDLIVPWDELRAMARIYEDGFRRRGLAFAIWGHVSDGNLHPNALPRNGAEAALGQEALLEFASEAARRGGSPLSEHGVGRSPLKQEILRRFLGDGAIEEMRSIKRALDPEGRFAPGVLFEAT